MFRKKTPTVPSSLAANGGEQQQNNVSNVARQLVSVTSVPVNLVT